jgi:hypothetical protein
MPGEQVIMEIVIVWAVGRGDIYTTQEEAARNAPKKPSWEAKPRKRFALKVNGQLFPVGTRSGDMPMAGEWLFLLNDPIELKDEVKE